MAEPFLEHNMHPTVIIRGYVQALEDAVSIIDSLAFKIDTQKREEMLKIVSSCIGTKFASRFGTLLPVSTVPFDADALYCNSALHCWVCLLCISCFKFCNCCQVSMNSKYIL